MGGLTLSGTSLYGMTTVGDGNLFRVGTNGSGYQSLFTFSGNGGAYPGDNPGGVLTLSGTTLYGATHSGGSGYGNVFSVGVDGSGFQNLISLSGTGGPYPGNSPGSPALSGTTLYETGLGGFAVGNDGNIFSVGTNGTGFQNLVTLSGTGGAFPGQTPEGGLALGGTTFYGVAFQGGTPNSGVIFSVGANGAGYKSLLTFNGTNGSYPDGGLTLSGTTLFGTTTEESGGYGNFFSVGIDGSSFRNLVSFTGYGGAYPGQRPEGGLTLIGTNLYGTTNSGANDYGTVFCVGTDGTGYRNLVSFTGVGGATREMNLLAAWPPARPPRFC